MLDSILELIVSKNSNLDQMFSVQYGSGGPRELLLRVSRVVRKDYPEFTPDGYEDWEKSQSEELRRTADHQVQQINIMVQKHIFTVFKQQYGEARDAYWEKGVVNKDIKTKAYSKSLDDGDKRLPLETYLDFIEYKKIIEGKDRWPTSRA